jgi:predicted metalloprotease with PDZ domain
VPHRFVVAGAAGSFDGERLLADAQKICEEAIRFWHGKRKPPHKSYLFMLNTGGRRLRRAGAPQQHALIASRAATCRAWAKQRTRPEGYTTLLGLISHEYFHTWNVKRLRPADFAQYDYTRENYTELLWFFEGFTSYYDDLLLRRALMDDAGLPQAVEQDHQPGAADTGARSAVGGRRPALTPGSSTTARTKTRPTPPSATTPRARWWRCAWT